MSTTVIPCAKKSILPPEKQYREAMDTAAHYNARLCMDRKLRLPFLDSQTGVAQSHSNLFMPYRYRRPGTRTGQLYSYPARSWKKKKSTTLLDVPMTKTSDIDGANYVGHCVDSMSSSQDTGGPAETSIVDTTQHHYKEYYDDWENISDPPDAGEIDDRNSDSSDYEETYVKKRKKKGKAKGGQGGGRGRKKQMTQEEKELDDKDKPYACETCGARYKTRPGLSYHLTHTHKTTEGVPPAEDDLGASPPIEHPIHPHPPERGSGPQSRYCDFCLGDEGENKKTGQREELVSCADCGRSGHPSCLQFTPNMIISVKRYPWQCIECKSCGLCGTSDNDDQLLFCDDCDRGYHMYCLNPPLSSPPDGSWSCHLCIVEFYGGQKPEGMQ